MNRDRDARRRHHQPGPIAAAGVSRQRRNGFNFGRQGTATQTRARSVAEESYPANEARERANRNKNNLSDISERGDRVMQPLTVKAYFKLVQFDLYLARRNFAALYDAVRRHSLGNTPCSSDVIERVCSSIDMACLWYWKEVLCLQRSAATTCLLRSHGVPAQMVICTQQMPFKAQPWVEVERRVVNDKPYVSEIYMVLDRC